MKKFPNIYKRIKENKSEIIVTLLWGVLLSLIVLWRYYDSFYKDPILWRYKVPYSGIRGAGFSGTDFLIVFLISLVSGTLFVDFKKLLWSWLSALTIAGVISITDLSLFFLIDLDICNRYYLYWDYAVFFAILNIFRIIFPFGILISLAGGFLGVILRTFIGK